MSTTHGETPRPQPVAEAWRAAYREKLLEAIWGSHRRSPARAAQETDSMADTDDPTLAVDTAQLHLAEAREAAVSRVSAAETIRSTPTTEASERRASPPRPAAHHQSSRRLCAMTVRHEVATAVVVQRGQVASRSRNSGTGMDSRPSSSSRVLESSSARRDGKVERRFRSSFARRWGSASSRLF